MTIPEGTPMDEDRRAMREQATRLLDVAKGINAMADDSAFVWGQTPHGARIVATRLYASTCELEAHLDELRAFRESVR